MKKKFKLIRLIKNVMFLIFCAFSPSISEAQQGVAINTAGTQANPSAILDISSTSQGILIPRVALGSTTDTSTINNPDTSLLVFNTNSSMIGGVVGFWYWDGTKWVQLVAATTPPRHYIGEPYGGGIIFYVDYTGQHGLIASTSDQSSGIEWSNLSTSLIGPPAQSFTDGLTNNNAIISQGATSGAAHLCDTLTLNGYTDWYLPSIEELWMLYNQLYSVGGFSEASIYWSSTEGGSSSAYTKLFYHNNNATTNCVVSKASLNPVRAIRKF